MNEVEWIEHLRRRIPGASGELVLGIGDDCAVYRPRGAREDLLFTTDATIEGTHFRRDEVSASFIGHKSLARALSDIAAMGGEPRFCLVALAAPRSWVRHVDEFYRGLLKLARETGTLVAGGDLSSAKQIVVAITTCGAVPRGAALRRDGAKPGDRIYVSGALGGAAARGYRVKPVPQIRAGRALRGRATACMDVSDGLAMDLRRMCEASGVSASLEEVPVARGATAEQALYGGEDYELLYTGPAGLPGIEIGRVTGRDRAAPVRLRGRAIAPRGYDHFG